MDEARALDQIGGGIVVGRRIESVPFDRARLLVFRLARVVSFGGVFLRWLVVRAIRRVAVRFYLPGVFADRLVVGAPGGGGVAVAPAPPTAALGFALLLLFLLVVHLGIEQGLTIAEGDLVVVGMDFGEGEKAVPVASVVDEGGLERGLDPRYFGEIDITAQLLLVRGLEVELLDAAAAQDDDPGFFGMRRIDKHFVGHGKLVEARYGRRGTARLVHRSDGGKMYAVPDGTARRSVGCRRSRRTEWLNRLRTSRRANKDAADQKHDVALGRTRCFQSPNQIRDRSCPSRPIRDAKPHRRGQVRGGTPMTIRFAHV